MQKRIEKLFKNILKGGKMTKTVLQEVRADSSITAELKPLIQPFLKIFNKHSLHALPQILDQYLKADLTTKQLYEVSQHPAYKVTLKKVSKFYFDHKEAVDIMDFPFEDLVNLKQLHLVRNELTELPQNISALKKLDTLSVIENSLTELPASLIELQKLKHVYLNDNQFKDIPSVLFELPNLKVISISNNQLVRVPKSIGKLQQLTNLNLSGNSIMSSKRRMIQSFIPNVSIRW